jgi:hypothetical protein
MPRIRFLHDAIVRNGAGEVVEDYRAGEVRELSAASCRRWIRRALAEEFTGRLPEVPHVDPQPTSGRASASGASRDSGPGDPSSASQEVQASPPQTSPESRPQEPPIAAESSSSTERSRETGQGLQPEKPIASMRRTRRGGARRSTRRDSMD